MAVPPNRLRIQIVSEPLPRRTPLHVKIVSASAIAFMVLFAVWLFILSVRSMGL